MVVVLFNVFWGLLEVNDAPIAIDVKISSSISIMRLDEDLTVEYVRFSK